jgi:hypothetical protein
LKLKVIPTSHCHQSKFLCHLQVIIYSKPHCCKFQLASTGILSSFKQNFMKVLCSFTDVYHMTKPKLHNHKNNNKTMKHEPVCNELLCAGNSHKYLPFHTQLMVILGTF